MVKINLNLFIPLSELSNYMPVPLDVNYEPWMDLDFSNLEIYIEGKRINHVVESFEKGIKAEIMLVSIE